MRLGSVSVVAWLAMSGAALAEESASTSTEGAQPEAAASVGLGAQTQADSANAAPVEDASAAERPAANAVFLEGLGPGLLYSVNYERTVIDQLAVRLGFSYWSVSASAGSASASSSFLTVPITVSYVGLRGLEVGAGMSLLYASGSGSTLGASASGSGISPLGTALVGYRLHPRGHAGFQFRVGAMAMMGKGLSLSASDPTAFGVLPWLYLSAGAGF